MYKAYIITPAVTNCGLILFIFLLLQAPVRCQVLKVTCTQGTCTLTYTGAEDNIFFWSKETALPDEIGWDFVNRVTSSHTSFTAFCTDRTREYRSVHGSSAPFCSKSTFVKWFFAWAANFCDDFRDSVDPWCRYNPRMLACDGTHIGVSVKHLQVSPIESPDNPHETVKPLHRRYNRVFLTYQQGLEDADVRRSRGHLKYVCKKTLSNVLPNEQLSEDDFQAANTVLLQVSPQDPECHTLLRGFVQSAYSADLLQKLAEFMIMLSGDAAVSTVLPLRYHNELDNVLISLEQNIPCNLQNLKEFCPELEACLSVARSHGELPDLIAFVRDRKSVV